MKHTLTSKKIDEYAQYLRETEHSRATIAKYVRDIRVFMGSLPEGTEISKETVLQYKQDLLARYKVASANSMLVALNSFFTFCGWKDLSVRTFKVQRRIFYDQSKELKREEYYRLLQIAESRKNKRLSLIMQTICSTGIRVSELQFITVEALRAGRAQIRNKGKDREVFFPKELVQILLAYCKKQGKKSGAVFVTKNNRPMDRSNIWMEMKALCREACVDPAKVFPHNLRHLFAVTFYRLKKDIVRLADILGHSSIETARIYTATSGTEHTRALSQLNLVLQT